MVTFFISPSLSTTSLGWMYDQEWAISIIKVALGCFILTWSVYLSIACMVSTWAYHGAVPDPSVVRWRFREKNKSSAVTSLPLTGGRFCHLTPFLRWKV